MTQEFNADVARKKMLEQLGDLLRENMPDKPRCVCNVNIMLDEGGTPSIGIAVYGRISPEELMACMTIATRHAVTDMLKKSSPVWMTVQ